MGSRAADSETHMKPTEQARAPITHLWSEKVYEWTRTMGQRVGWLCRLRHLHEMRAMAKVRLGVGTR